jgi:hypothetical protein
MVKFFFILSTCETPLTSNGPSAVPVAGVVAFMLEQNKKLG